MKNKSQSTNQKTPVAVYIKYEEGNLTEMKKKEEILTKYCEEQNYDIVKKYFDNEGSIYQYFSNTMRKVLRNIGNHDYYTLITCDFKELSDDITHFMAIYAVLQDEDIIIETLNQGIVGEDMLLDGNCFLNVLNKKELFEPRIRYNSSGEVIDTTKTPF